MAGIEYPLWYGLKSNIVDILTIIAAEETIVNSSRNFLVQKDRWRPWIEAQQEIPLVNVMVQGSNQDSGSSASRIYSTDEVTVNVDMYVLGQAGETLPADEIAAERLDLLVAQVREGLTRLDLLDFGFPIGQISRDQNFTLTYYDQQNEESTGQYAPARWSFNVKFPFYPQDKGNYVNLSELNVTINDDLAELYKLKFNYS